MIPGISSGRRRFADLSEQEVLALAISNEEDDARIYRQYAQRLREEFPASAKVFEEMAIEEDEHRKRLIEAHKRRFGEVIPLIRREHVSGFYARNPIWLVENLGLERMRAEALEVVERGAHVPARLLRYQLGGIGSEVEPFQLRYIVDVLAERQPVYPLEVYYLAFRADG